MCPSRLLREGKLRELGRRGFAKFEFLRKLSSQGVVSDAKSSILFFQSLITERGQTTQKSASLRYVIKQRILRTRQLTMHRITPTFWHRSLCTDGFVCQDAGHVKRVESKLLSDYLHHCRTVLKTSPLFILLICITNYLLIRALYNVTSTRERKVNSYLLFWCTRHLDISRCISVKTDKHLLPFICESFHAKYGVTTSPWKQPPSFDNMCFLVHLLIWMLKFFP